MTTAILITGIVCAVLLVIVIILLIVFRRGGGDDRLHEEMRTSRQEIQQGVTSNVKTLGDMLASQQKDSTESQDKRLREINEQLANQQNNLRASVNDSFDKLEKRLVTLTEQTDKRLENVRETVDRQLTVMREGNEKKLDEMRSTVDEKLQKTLEERINKSFELVSRNLDEVSKGLGEMKTLAGDVGGLKKVLSGVKTRGILGEVQLGAILKEILAPGQYEENIATVKGSQNRVEYAIRLPGAESGEVYLPIDAKFPLDAYSSLLEAYDSGDAETVQAAQKVLEQRLKLFAKEVRTKYVSPPDTTDFAIIFLPIEGLYAEVVRLGLIETLQSEYKVNIAGPTTMAALLNSLQMGFRTLAIQKRSSEVWEILGAVKTEFGKFEEALKRTQQRIEQAGDDLEKLVGTRTNTIVRSLRRVEELPEEDAVRLLPEADTARGDEDL